MTMIVFCGPTLSDRDRRQFPDIAFLPPVQQGHLYRAAKNMPQAIGIIDGYFDGVPAVLHKEILWALAEGIAVFGASSMGALRAAELHSFGMKGVGRIFEDFRDGRLTDDDEVALVHGPAELGYPALGEPMVNIRATVERARAEGMLNDASAQVVSSVAKELFYQERTWASVLKSTGDVLGVGGVERFGTWLETNKVDQKRKDALLMLAAMEDFTSSGQRASEPNFVFQYTAAWAGAPWLAEPHNAEDEPSENGHAILNELRLQGEAYARIRREALLRMLAEAHAGSVKLRVSRHDVGRATASLRLRHGMSRQADLVRWSQANDIGAAELQRLSADEATLDKLARTLDRDLRGRMLDRLRAENAYLGLRERASRKRDIRPRSMHSEKGKLPTGLLVEWYFRDRLGTDTPRDLMSYVEGLGLENQDDFYRLLAEEHFFSREDGNTVRQP